MFYLVWICHFGKPPCTARAVWRLATSMAACAMACWLHNGCWPFYCPTMISRTACSIYIDQLAMPMDLSIMPRYYRRKVMPTGCGSAGCHHVFYCVATYIWVPNGFQQWHNIGKSLWYSHCSWKAHAQVGALNHYQKQQQGARHVPHIHQECRPEHLSARWSAHFKSRANQNRENSFFWAKGTQEQRNWKKEQQQEKGTAAHFF